MDIDIDGLWLITTSDLKVSL